MGLISAIHYRQKDLQAGLAINCPVLVMYSSKSVTPGKYHKSMHTSDSVLRVDDISRVAEVIGKQVKKAEIKDGVHDLVLSRKSVRENVFNEMTSFLKMIS